MNETIKTPNTMISLKDVAARLSLSTRAVYRLIASGTLPRPFKVGGAVRFLESDIEKFFENLQATRR